MFRFSLLALMSTVVAAAVACAVLFVFPYWLRASVLFVGVLAIPGPLYVLYRNGGFAVQSFALGGLVAYGAWFIIVGVPGGFGVVTSSTQLNLGSVAYFADQSFAANIGQNVNLSGYVFFAMLYAPWLIVPLAGLTSLGVCWFARKDNQN
jgi:hypothetical protein